MGVKSLKEKHWPEREVERDVCDHQVTWVACMCVESYIIIYWSI